MTARILYVISSLDRYGGEQQLALLAAHLPAGRFDVHICHLDPAGPAAGMPAAAEVRVTNLRRRWRLDPLAAAQLERLLADLRPDLVHTGSISAGVYEAVAARFAGQSRLVVGQGARDRRPTWRRQALGRWLARNARSIVVPRDAVREDFVRQGWPVEKFVVIPPAAAPAVASRRARGDVLSELELPDEAKLIGLIGRLEVEEGWKEVIWTLDILRCLRDDLHLIVVGDGRQRRQLERFVRLCTMGPNIHFIGQRPDLADLLPHFNHVWQGSGERITPAGVIESLAAGVPVVASNTANNREWVIHDQTGFLVPRGDRAGRAHYANRLINDPGLRTRLGEAGRHRIASQFQLEPMVARHVELYERVLST